MLVKLDRSSMRHGLEVRSPFLDKDLVDFAFSLSGRQKIGFFRGKNILRKAFIKKFQKVIYNFQKKDLRFLWISGC